MEDYWGGRDDNLNTGGKGAANANAGAVAAVVDDGDVEMGIE